MTMVRMGNILWNREAKFLKENHVVLSETRKLIRICTSAFLTLLFFGCQPTVYLMPTPSVLSTGEHNPYAANPYLEESNRVPVLYATNRQPRGDSVSRKYLKRFGDDLFLGIADLSIGTRETTWEILYQRSTSAEGKEQLALSLENVNEMVLIEANAELTNLSPEARDFFELVNEALAKSIDKDIMVYVHGANSGVYRATAQAAQYRHFTGRNSVVLAFLWPSAESLLQYSIDVRNAEKTVPVFARLIDLLSRHSNAANINILAYSAGAQIASPGLALLGKGISDDERQQLRKRLRLGEVYYAAPDIDLKVFIEHLPMYVDLTRNVTMSLNSDDSVLSWAEIHHKVSRAGRPNPDDLTPAEIGRVREASMQTTFSIIAVGAQTIPDMNAGAHNYWYQHPWVSSDVLIQFLFHASPEERGLEADYSEKGIQYWIYPEDYPERIISILRDAKEQRGP